MERIVQVGQLPNGRWRVYSRTGKNLGTFSSRKAAQRRAAQFERFIRMNRKRAEVINCRKMELNKLLLQKVSKDNIDTLITPTVTYSSLMRKLRQDHPEKVKEFMLVFKRAFDAAVDQELDDLEQVALLEAIQKLDLQKFENK